MALFLLKFFIWKGKSFAWFSFPTEKVKSKLKNCHSLTKILTSLKNVDKLILLCYNIFEVKEINKVLKNDKNGGNVMKLGLIKGQNNSF